MPKTILITGSTDGIGLETAKLLAAAGHNVLLHGRNPHKLAEAARILSAMRDGGSVETYNADLSRIADVEALASEVTGRHSGLDVLINNAGSLINKPFLEISSSDFEAVFKVNVFAVASLTRLMLPMINAKGHVLNITSMGGVQGSAKFPGLSAYSSSKGALVILTELLAEEFKDSGPSFNALALGAVQTEMLEEAFPGYKAPVSAVQMAEYIIDFALKGHQFYNGKVLPISSSTP